MEETLAAITRAQEAQVLALDAAEAERTAAADERERARSGVARARREAGDLLAEARRAADDMLARAEREVGEVRRELTRQRNLSGSRAKAGGEAFDDLKRRAARVRAGPRRPARRSKAGRTRTSPARNHGSDCGAARERSARLGRASNKGRRARHAETEKGGCAPRSYPIGTTRVVAEADQRPLTPTSGR